MTPDSPAPGKALGFGRFRFDPASGELFRGSERITRLQPKLAETLRILLERRGQVLDKDELMRAVWPDVHVAESNLSRAISELRTLIGKEWIETIPRRGFRFRTEGELAQLLGEAPEPGGAQGARQATEKEPAEKEPTGEEPAEEEPAGKEPAEEEPAEEEPADKEPAEKELAQKEPTGEESAEEPAEGEPADKEPTEKQPAEREPAKRLPRWLVAALATLGAVAIVVIGAVRHVDSEADQAPSPAARTFYVYRDAASPENHFRPTGYMGDCGDIEIQEADEERPYSGQTSIRIRYLAQGKGPHACPYQPPCRWAGVYWQHPPNNFGTEVRFKDAGYNLTGFRRLRFAARADRPVRIEFTVGGIDERYGDSLREGRRLVAKVGRDWQEFEVDLAGADLKHIIGGFAWSTNWANAPEGVTLWLDEIRFERD